MPGVLTAGIRPVLAQAQSVCLVVRSRSMTSVVVSIVLRLRSSAMSEFGVESRRFMWGNTRVELAYPDMVAPGNRTIRTDGS